VLRHTNTYSKADLTDKQLSQEQNQKYKNNCYYFVNSWKLFVVQWLRRWTFTQRTYVESRSRPVI